MTKILVIEDEAILRDEMVEWLTLEDYETLYAEDGIAGVEAAFKHMPDLIISDITMPRLTGYGVLLEIRANPVTSTTPFIFLTAHATYEDIREGMTMGADDYLTKPFTRLELLNAIQTRLEKKALQDHAYQQQLEQLERALVEEREQRLLTAKLVAMFSHDFRNPLTSILSSNGLLRDYADRLEESRRLTHLNRIEASVRQLLQMLDDMLVVAQMDAGSLVFKPQLLNLGEFLQGIVEEFQTINAETHLLTFEDKFGGTIQADVRLLRQIAVNLISNAIKYSRAGSHVEVILENGSEQHCTLTVKDEGIGIPIDDQQHLFEAFVRGSNVGKISGTGLGLAIIKQAVDLHGGSIFLESRAQQGTTLAVTFPKK